MAVDIGALRKLLAEEYGIRSDRELLAAMNSMTKINIGVCASPVEKKEVSTMKKTYAARMAGAFRDAGAVQVGCE